MRGKQFVTGICAAAVLALVMSSVILGREQDSRKRMPAVPAGAESAREKGTETVLAEQETAAGTAKVSAAWKTAAGTAKASAEQETAAGTSEEPPARKKIVITTEKENSGTRETIAGPNGTPLTQTTAGPGGTLSESEQAAGPGGALSEGERTADPNGTPPARESSSGPGAEPAGEETSAASETPRETAGQYLPDLSGFKPGDVIEKERLDPEHPERYFTGSEITEGDAIYRQIIGKSYQVNDAVALSDLRYLKLLHYNFDGRIQVGELIVNQSLVSDFIGIFRELFAEQYQIESMYLIDRYWTGDPDDTDTASIEENNTSCFCFRNATGGNTLSYHAMGKAIDLNPRQNPYVTYDASGTPHWTHENASAYIDRDSGAPHVITHEDTAFRIFQKYGFTWGGDWKNPVDYQHFEKE